MRSEFIMSLLKPFWWTKLHSLKSELVGYSYLTTGISILKRVRITGSEVHLCCLNPSRVASSTRQHLWQRRGALLFSTLLPFHSTTCACSCVPP